MQQHNTTLLQQAAPIQYHNTTPSCPITTATSCTNTTPSSKTFRNAKTLFFTENVFTIKINDEKRIIIAAAKLC